MSLALKGLAGDLPATKTALYTCPADKTAYIKTVSLVNKSGMAATVILWKKKSGGSSVSLVNIDLENRYRLEYDDGIILEAGDALEGQCPDGTDCYDYSIEGSEESLTLVSP